MLFMKSYPIPFLLIKIPYPKSLSLIMPNLRVCFDQMDKGGIQRGKQTTRLTTFISELLVDRTH